MVVGKGTRAEHSWVELVGLFLIVVISDCCSVVRIVVVVGEEL